MSRNRNFRILFAASAGIVQRLVQIPVGFIVVPLVLHTLGVAGLGVWGAATSIAWLYSMLDLGLGSALVTLLPRSLGAGQVEQAQDYVTASLQGGIFLAVLVLLAGSSVICSSLVPMPSPPFIVAGCAVTLNIPLSMGNEMWVGLQKGYGAAGWQIFGSLLTLAMLFAAAHVHAGIMGMTIVVYLGMLAANIGSLVHVLAAHPQLRPRWRLHAAALRTVLTQGSQMFAITIAAALAYALDNVLALSWLGPEASARMTIAMRVCTTAMGLIGVITQPFWPGFANAYAEADYRWIRRTLSLGTLAIMALAGAGSIFIIIFGAPVLQWWLHQNLQLPRSLFWVMAAWICAGSLSHMPGLLLHAALRLRPQIILLSLVAGLGLVLKYFAALHFGVSGMLLVSALLWLFLSTPCYFWLAQRALPRAT